jgi:hypothetical protein
MQQESQNWIRDFDGLTYSAVLTNSYNSFKTVLYALVSLSVMTLISVLKDYLISDLKIKMQFKTYSA